jgi:hypothetical protein
LVVEDIVSRQAFGLSVEHARDERHTPRVVIEHPCGQATPPEKREETIFEIVNQDSIRRVPTSAVTMPKQLVFPGTACSGASRRRSA